MLFISISPFPTQFSKALFFNPFAKQAIDSTCLLYKPYFKNTLGKGAIPPFSQRVYFHFRELSTFSIKFKIVVWKLFNFGSV